MQDGGFITSADAHYVGGFQVFSHTGGVTLVRLCCEQESGSSQPVER
jgi:hypothetical protein